MDDPQPRATTSCPDPVHDGAPAADGTPDDRAPDDLHVVGARPFHGPIAFYTAPCAGCGRRLRLSEDELLTSLTTPPVCWLCDG